MKKLDTLENEMKIKKMIATMALFLSLSVAGTVQATNSFVASGDASGEMSQSLVNLTSASGDLSVAAIHLGGDIVIGLGRPVAQVVRQAAEISSDSLAFSAEVLADGLITTTQLSSELALAGVEFSADAATLVTQASAKGIHISADTAELFLDQAVQIAAASGRLSEESVELVFALGAVGVELSADSVQLAANASRAGLQISEETASGLISACLEVAAESIEATVITERYILMTLEEANRLLHETSLATVAATQRAGQQSYNFTIETAGHLKSLGIDSAKYAYELTLRTARTTARKAVVAIEGSNDAIVVVINSGSGLIVASLDSLTAAVKESTDKIQ